VGIRCADHVTTIYPQKAVLSSPTVGGRSVGIVHSRTKASEFSLVHLMKFFKFPTTLRLFYVVPPRTKPVTYCPGSCHVFSRKLSRIIPEDVTYCTGSCHVLSGKLSRIVAEAQGFYTIQRTYFLVTIKVIQCNVANYFAGGKIETNEMGRACGAYGGG
jgi:hypothetical protein